MASLRRSSTPLNDVNTAKFLYTILKQLDHKSIDWAVVASELDITNGHAARMRFSRFKQHMEGVQPSNRKPRAERHTQLKSKLDKKRKQDDKSKNAATKAKSEETKENHGRLDFEEGSYSFDDKGSIKNEAHIKEEHDEDNLVLDPSIAQAAEVGLHGFDGVMEQPDSSFGYEFGMGVQQTGYYDESGQFIKYEPVNTTIKEEIDGLM